MIATLKNNVHEYNANAYRNFLMHNSMKCLGQPLLLKTDFRLLISWCKFSILEQRLNPLYSKVSIKLHLQDVEIKLSELVKTSLNIGFH